MKLWKKLSIIFSLVLVTIIVAFSLIIIFKIKDEMLNSALNQAVEKQQSLQTAFSTMVGYYLLDGDGQTTTSSLMKYCFSCFADETSVLIADNNTIYTYQNFQPEKVLQLDNYTISSCLERIGGQSFIIVGSVVVVRQQFCRIYTVENITELFLTIRRLILELILIGFGCIFIGAFVITVISQRSLKPLKLLSATSRHIATGQYSERIPINTKDEIGDLSADFNSMAAAVENKIAELTEIAERQRLFLGGVTHEIKTPITTILLNADALLNVNQAEKQRIRSMLLIQQQGRWIDTMVQKLLRLITLRSEIAKEEVQLDDFWGDIRSMLEEMLKKRKISLMINCKAENLYADKDLLASIIINLVDNASKASEPGQQVQLNTFDNVIEVIDNGCGMPEDEVDRIIEPFYVIDKSRSKIVGGCGLGLTLVNEIVNAHGAKLSISSRIGLGTVVRIYFPR